MQFDYTYQFHDLKDGYTPVQQIRSQAHQPEQLFYVRISDQQFHWKRRYHLSSLHSDCIDLAGAIAVADRFSIRTRDRSCSIQICLPVRHPELFGDPLILRHLQDVLYWYTHDQWFFHFSPRSGYGRLSERQLSLLPSSSWDPSTEVALWSGGLDSLAGLYTQLKNNAGSARFILFGTGANTFIHRKQIDTAQLIETLFPGQTTLLQVPLRLDETKTMDKHPLQRSRGFVFLFLGAICAMLEGHQSLSVYENGIGAINLPFTQAEVGLDHSRSVHPVSLIRMGEFLTRLFGAPFSFQNPFLFQTKAQMCAALTDTADFDRLISSTFTCDRYLRDRPQQCGRCSSCLLRRQAIAALNRDDPTSYNITSVPLPRPKRRIPDDNHLRAMLAQVSHLRVCLTTENPWKSLTKYYPQLLEIVDEMAEKKILSKETLSNNLVRLYERYVGEWDEHVCQVVQRDFREDSTDREIVRGD